MKIKVWVSIGLVGCKREAEIEVPDEDVVGISEEARAEVCQGYADEWAMERCEWGYEPI